MQKLSEDLQYLTSPMVGNIILEGLAATYDAQPQYPITYLANWLLNHRKTELNEKVEQESEKKRLELIERFNANLKKQEEEQKQIQTEQEKKDEIIQVFRKKIAEHSYHEELLVQDFPDFIRQTLNLSASYVGFLSYPLKEFSEDDEDPNAHLDMTAEKLIRYIGASQNQKFIIGNTLQPETGITYEAFRPPEEEEEQPEDEEEGILKGPKPTYVYVEDVTKEPRMVYFRIPRLGAFICNSLSYKSVLNETAFDEGVKERQRVQKERAEQQKEKDEKEAEFQEKIDDAQENGGNVTEIEEEWKNMEWDEIQEKEFEYEEQKYVLCGDTLGEDREIPEEKRARFEELAKFFVKCWEESENRQLSNDIDLQIKYLEDFNKDDYLDDLNDKLDDAANNKTDNQDEEEEAEGEAEEEAAAAAAGISIDKGEVSELKLTYRQAVAKTEVLKKAFLEDEEIKEYLTMLKDYRVVKYLGIIQTALILIGYTKEEINIPGTNILNWKKVSRYLHAAGFFEKLELYRYKGPKTEKYKPYQTVQRILRRLEGYVVEEIDDFNIALGVLYRYMKQLLETRILDVQVRKEDKANKRARREQIIQAVEERRLKKEQEFEEAKAQQQAEQDEKEREKADAREESNDDEQEDDEEAFNWEEWEEEWNRVFEEENPPLIVPDEVQDDIDEDMEVELNESD